MSLKEFFNTITMGIFSKGNTSSGNSLQIASYLEDIGTANAYQVLSRTTVSSYTAGLRISFKAASTNSGPASLVVNDMIAINIKKDVTSDLGAGDIVEDQIVDVVFDGTNFQLLTTSTDGGTGTSGTSGTAGSSGTSGANGSSGGNGTSGTSATGAAGSSGTSGTSATGSVGAAGTSGTSGSNGTSGINGNTGTSGSSGVNGTSGTSSSGTSGTSGSSGQSGVSGSSGTSGGQGIQGTGGTSGTSGVNGTFTGSSGTSGTTGATGATGGSGTSGTSGQSGSSGTSGGVGGVGNLQQVTDNGNITTNNIELYVLDPATTVMTDSPYLQLQSKGNNAGTINTHKWKAFVDQTSLTSSVGSTFILQKQFNVATAVNALRIFSNGSVAFQNTSAGTSSYSFAFNSGATATGVGAVVLSQNAIGAGTTCFIAGGQNHEIASTTIGATSLCTDGFTKLGANYSFVCGDANVTWGYASSTHGFGNLNYGNYGFVAGNDNILGHNTSIFDDTKNNLYQNGVILGSISRSYLGSFHTLIGRALEASSANNIIVMGNGLVDGTRLAATEANSFNVGFNSTIPTLKVSAAGGAGLAGITTVAGALKINTVTSIVNDDALTDILVRASDGTVKYRTATSLGGGGGTNIYSADGTLSADRTLSLSTFDLAIKKGANSVLTLTDTERVIMGTGTSSAVGKVEIKGTGGNLYHGTPVGLHIEQNTSGAYWIVFKNSQADILNPSDAIGTITYLGEDGDFWIESKRTVSGNDKSTEIGLDPLTGSITLAAAKSGVGFIALWPGKATNLGTIGYGVAYTASRNDGVSTTNRFLSTDSLGNMKMYSIQSGGAETITKASHGFTVGMAVQKDEFGVWRRCQAIFSSNLSYADGYVASVIDVNTFTIVQKGARINTTGLGLSTNTVYYLSTSGSGVNYTTTLPSVGEIYKEVFRTNTANEATIIDGPSQVVSV